MYFTFVLFCWQKKNAYNIFQTAFFEELLNKQFCYVNVEVIRFRSKFQSSYRMHKEFFFTLNLKQSAVEIGRIFLFRTLLFANYFFYVFEVILLIISFEVLGKSN